MKNKTPNEKKNAKKAPLFSWKYLVYDFVKVTGALPGIVWFRTKVIWEGTEAPKALRGGALLISNHLGFFDPIYLMFGVWFRRHHFICSKELAQSKVGPLLRRVLCIPIDRENFNTDSFREITAHLSAGELVTMFPEGHINTAEEKTQVASFKSGMILLALRAGTPIVPVFIRPKTKWWQRLVMVIGEPIDIRTRYGERPTFAQIDEAARDLQKKENELYSYIR